MRERESEIVTKKYNNKNKNLKGIIVIIIIIREHFLFSKNFHLFIFIPLFGA